jgi:hypothetical protein
LQAGGRRFDPGTLHLRIPACAGILVSASLPEKRPALYSSV